MEMRPGTIVRTVTSPFPRKYVGPYQSIKLGTVGQLVDADKRESFVAFQFFGPLCGACMDRGGRTEDEVLNKKLKKDCDDCAALRNGQVPSPPPAKAARRSKRVDDDKSSGGNDEMATKTARKTSRKASKAPAKKAAAKRAHKPGLNRGRNAHQNPGIVAKTVDALQKKGQATIPYAGPGSRSTAFYAAKKAGVRVSTTVDGNKLNLKVIRKTR